MLAKGGRRRVEIFAITGEEGSELAQLPEGILKDWELVSFNSEGIEFNFTFGNPVSLSQGDTPELLLM